MRIFPLVLSLLVVPLLLAPGSAVAPLASTSLVGGPGNEPIIRVGPDGTAYVSALQYLYRSTDGGLTFQRLVPSLTAVANLASDSSIDLSDDGSRLYATYDWPYAGAQTVCLSQDHGATWTCNDLAVPPADDRMWIRILPDLRSFFVVDAVDISMATTFLSTGPDSVIYAPKQLPQGSWRGDFAQGWGPTAHDGMLVQEAGTGQLYFYNATGDLVGIEAHPWRSSGLPSMARDAAGNLYGFDEAGGVLTLERRLAGSNVWESFRLATGGRARLPAIAAGPAGDVTFLYYRESSPGKWTVASLRSRDAAGPAPTWAQDALGIGIVHAGTDVCWSCGATGARFAGDFISATYAPDGSRWFSWVWDGRGVYATHVTG